MLKCVCLLWWGQEAIAWLLSAAVWSGCTEETKRLLSFRASLHVSPPPPDPLHTIQGETGRTLGLAVTN